MVEAIEALGQQHTEQGGGRRQDVRTNMADYWMMFLVAIVTAGVRLWNIDWGLPYIYHFDEPNNLAIAVRMIETGDLNPHFFNYGSLLFYLNALVISVVSIMLQFGGWTGVVSVDALVMNSQGSGLTNEPWLFLGSRLVSVAVCVATAVIVYRLIARVTESRLSGVFGGFLFGIAPIAVHEGRLVTPNALTALFAVAVLHFSIKIYEGGLRRDYLWAGAMVGLATGTKYNAAFVGIGVIVAHVLRKRKVGTVLERGPLIAIYASLAFFLVSTPFALLDPAAFLADLGFELTHYSNGHMGQSDAVAEYVPSLLTAFSLGLLFIPFAFRESTVRAPAAIATVMGVGYVGFLMLFTTAFQRNLLPALPCVAVACGFGLAAFLRTNRDRSAYRILGLVACLVALAVSGLATYRAESSVVDRTESVQWIAESLPRGSRVLVEWYSPWVDPQHFDVGGAGLFVLLPPEPGWDYMLLAGGGSLWVGSSQAEFPAGAESLDSIREATCLLKVFPGVVEVRVPSC